MPSRICMVVRTGMALMTESTPAVSSLESIKNRILLLCFAVGSFLSVPNGAVIAAYQPSALSGVRHAASFWRCGRFLPACFMPFCFLFYGYPHPCVRRMDRFVICITGVVVVERRNRGQTRMQTAVRRFFLWSEPWKVCVSAVRLSTASPKRTLSTLRPLWFPQ